MDMSTEPVPKLLTILEVAAALGVCEETARRLVWRGELASTRVGRSVRVRVDDLRAYLELHRGLVPAPR